MRATARDAIRERQDRFGLLVGVLLLCCCAVRVFTYVIDDAFITYRYAWHFRHGYGPVFNPGERTEGYSCPLYMALNSLLMFLPGDPLFRAKIIGLACAICTLWVVWRLTGELAASRRVRIMAPLLLGATASFALSAIDGMETSLQALLVTLAVFLFIRERRSGRGWASAPIFLAAALNRAEGAIYFAAALIPFILDIRRRFQRRDAIWLCVFLLPMSLFILWRHAYYGDWLPNTVVAKSMPLSTALDFAMGPAYLLRTIFGNLSGRTGAVVISICLWLLVILGAECPEMKQGGARLIVFAVLAQALVLLRSGGDWMTGWRYMMASVPLWTLLLAAGADRIVVHVTTPLSATGTRLAASFGFGALLVVFGGAAIDLVAIIEHDLQASTSWPAAGWTTDARKMVQRLSIRGTLLAADSLNVWLPPGSSIAYSEMGVIPFFTLKLRWLDTDGLTDRAIAHLDSALHTRAGVQYGAYLQQGTEVGQMVLQRRPDYILAHYSEYNCPQSIFGGAYLLYRRIPMYDRPHHIFNMLIVFRRRPELDAGQR
jgi:hypothetical protein